METIKIEIKNATGAVSAAAIESLDSAASEALEKLRCGTGQGNDFLGWLDLPSATKSSLLEEIQAAANELSAHCKAIVVIGIGGSYLGAKAVIEALSDSFDRERSGNGVSILFAGQNIGEDYLYELQRHLEDKEFGIIVISKSGTTTEPAIAFRLLKTQLEKQVGKSQAAKRIIAVTDARRGALRRLAAEEGYKTFVIEDNIGGRFSVLSPVGLLPIAAAGFDIKALMQGALEMEKGTQEHSAGNIAETYAKTRNALYRAGKKIEILENSQPTLHYFGEWWKQIYGESEGKGHKGIFPAAVDNSTDLHSMGQWIQDGERSIFETVISVQSQAHETIIPFDEANLDGLNFIAGKKVDQVNKMAELGTTIAHVQGGVPNIRITLPALKEEFLGQLIYFFEKACGISGYILGVNPFDQPGVEEYKRNMFALLEKPGYEKESKAIRSLIGD